VERGAPCTPLPCPAWVSSKAGGSSIAPCGGTALPRNGGSFQLLVVPLLLGARERILLFFLFSRVSLVDPTFKCSWDQSLLPKFLYTAKNGAAAELTWAQAGDLQIHHRDLGKSWTHGQLGRRNGLSCPAPLPSAAAERWPLLSA